MDYATVTRVTEKRSSQPDTLLSKKFQTYQLLPASDPLCIRSSLNPILSKNSKIINCLRIWKLGYAYKGHQLPSICRRFSLTRREESQKLLLELICWKDPVFVKCLILSEITIVSICSVLHRKREEMTVDVDEAVRSSNKSPNYGDGISWRTIVDRLNNLSSDEIQLLRFDSIEDVRQFYLCHSKMVGFGIRERDQKKDKNGIVTYKRWVCNKEGFRNKKCFNLVNRKREAKRLTRVGCSATIIVQWNTDIQKFTIKRFEMDHNHELANQEFVQFLRSHRSVKKADLDHAVLMHGVGIRIPQILDLQAYQSGGYNKIGYTEKDLRNAIDQLHRNALEVGDASQVLAYLDGRAKGESNFFYKHAVDPEKRLIRLFWRDSQSRLDYQCFGDVLVFDSTYRTNAYRKPLVILAGVNHHYTTTIFGSALIADETEDTYKWVLETFLEAMDEKAPISVVTDGDGAMRNAIKTVIPYARHRLCTWHLKRNVVTNTKKEFVHDFTVAMDMICSHEEFDKRWHLLIEKHNLKDNQWLQDLYKKREKWAAAFLRGHFYAGMNTTQRSEQLNASAHKYLQSKMLLFPFAKRFELFLSKVR